MRDQNPGNFFPNLRPGGGWALCGRFGFFYDMDPEGFLDERASDPGILGVCWKSGAHTQNRATVGCLSDRPPYFRKTSNWGICFLPQYFIKGSHKLSGSHKTFTYSSDFKSFYHKSNLMYMIFKPFCETSPHILISLIPFDDAYTVRIEEEEKEILEKVPLFIQKLNPTLRAGKIKFSDVIRTRIPQNEGVIVRLMIEDVLIPEVERLQGSIRGLGGMRWTLQKRGLGEETAPPPPRLTRLERGTATTAAEGITSSRGDGVAQSSSSGSSGLSNQMTSSINTRGDGVDQAQQQAQYGPVGGQQADSHHGGQQQ